ncbi:DUF5060 domain-containing protein [Paenibacillus sp. V4I7]|uniref:DUF5060 domain-containing protein n=1 Tax=Paenibacillus sp. V4I7 TaxID=3042307 RepID=UPI002783695F|nr:DUF5060 domain-containing protein [Paenibacillus sp. V4I7]MDQ0899494.1 hypothetical protein [Paenibacillus sp. V4I7]
MNRKVEQWDMFELSVKGPAEGNPFTDVTFSATFKQRERSIEVPGFYDGAGTYKVRFMPGEQGVWTYETSGNLSELKGLSGEFECVAPAEGNHGPVKVSDTYHFAYADGTPHDSVGTTCYVWTHQGDELEELTLRTLKKAPFNKMRMCVFPKHYLYNNNDPLSYPFEGSREEGWNFTRFNPEFFRHFEKRVDDLRNLGIEADIILFHPYDNGRWGFDKMGMEVNIRYLRYLIARLSAFRNIWWSMANEYDLMGNMSIDDWDVIIQTVAEYDPYDHLRSIHNCGPFYDHNHSLLTHVSVQNSNLRGILQWREQYNKPVVVDECAYEGNLGYVWGNVTEQEMTRRFWEGFLSGGYVGHGETYVHPDEILWWSKGGELHGQSPDRIAFMKEIMESVPREYREPVTFQPHWENSPCIGKEGEYYLVYFGIHRPAVKYLELTKDRKYKIEIINTWEMTVTPLEGIYDANSNVELPGKQYIALRIQKT